MAWSSCVTLSMLYSSLRCTEYKSPISKDPMLTRITIRSNVLSRKGFRSRSSRFSALYSWYEVP